ncbi:SET methyltransferase domain containing protein [Nitzschia inconspicua]|uniref:SET methyltransferase domain containing protein n=1 Tax=Nitzschia inconspicua TaxID=303405 RepID=A0A9K3KAU1_9STRA|nr:SET methyltransferase domain containing protein [Nitzschia inconspicua]
MDPCNSPFCPLAFAFSSDELWAIRIASAGLTYFGFVAVTDRPRGQLKVPKSAIEIKESTVSGAGLGLYLKQDFPKGTILGDYPGVVLPLAQHSESNKMQVAPFSEAYIWRFSDNKFVIDPTDNQGFLQETCRGGNPGTPLSVGIFATILSFVTVPSALCRINEPPKGRDVNVITEEDLKARKVTFVLERDCYTGEELFIDYGLSYDRSLYGGGGE